MSTRRPGRRRRPTEVRHPVAVTAGASGGEAAPSPEGEAPLRALEIRGRAEGLLDDPLVLHARGAGPGATVVWQARYLDDDARVWRATAPLAAQLTTGLAPAKAGTGPLAALASLRPVSIEVRVQAADGRAATRTLTARLAAEGVRLRRWRAGVTATLHLPASGDPPCATVVLDATAGPAQAHVAALASPLLASRGVLVLSVGRARGGGGEGNAERIALAGEGVAAVPGATEPVVLRAVDPFGEGEAGPGVVLPPGVGARDADPGAAAARAVAWDALLLRLGARPREHAGQGEARIT